LSRELRTTNSYAFYDDPARLFRLFRFQHVLGFSLVPRTQSQLENALLANYQAAAPADSLAGEIRAAALDANVAAMLEGLDASGLLKTLSPALTGAKLNTAGIAKFERLAHTVLPSGNAGGWLAFLSIFVEKLSARERTDVVRAFSLSAAETATFKKLGPQAEKLESLLKSARVHRPSQVWEVLRDATTDDVLLVLQRSSVRLVQDRIRAYYEKYLPLSQEVTDEDVVAAGAKPGTAKFEKLRRSLISTRLNARPRKIELVEPEPVPLAAAGGITRR
jgi:tRNA nucleotidyltransferase/poly(A) polymerase